MKKECNVNGIRFNCQTCPRAFKCEISFTLHLYWHKLLDEKSKAHRKGGITDDLDEIEDPSDEEDNNDIEFRFTASPGWLKKFQERCNVGHLKMKGEKGSENYE